MCEIRLCRTPKAATQLTNKRDGLAGDREVSKIFMAFCFHAWNLATVASAVQLMCFFRHQYNQQLKSPTF
jgi:hypothetical protein